MSPAPDLMAIAADPVPWLTAIGAVLLAAVAVLCAAIQHHHRRTQTARADRLAERIAAIETARRRENDRWAPTLQDLLNLTDPQPAESRTN